MYSTKERIFHHQQLRNSAAAEADLSLLKKLAADNTYIVRYEVAPQRNADDILFELLGVATHEEIVSNRRNFEKQVAETQQAPKPAKKAKKTASKKPAVEKKSK